MVDLIRALKAGTSMDAFDENEGITRFDIFEINVTNSKDSVIRTLGSLGFTDAAKDIEESIDNISVKVLNQLTDLALQAAKSTVPYRSGTLRNKSLKSTLPYFRRGRNFNQTRLVYIDGPHNPPYRKRIKSAAAIAVALDTNAYTRGGLDRGGSSVSIPEPGFSSVGPGLTINWTVKASNQLEKRKDKLLLSKFI